jgi:NADP-dependent 3-hydroxy acid dehydrogenase YdfG
MTAPYSPTDSQGPLVGAVVVVTGAGGAAGQATVARLLADGATVVAADRSVEALAGLVAAAGDAADRLEPVAVDLLDAAATQEWAASLEAERGHVDGVIHLVGGWRGGKRFADNTFADWEFLHSLLIRTVQTTTLAFHDPLLRSAENGRGGRFVLVSAQAAAAPTAGNAGYAAAKSAAEAWTLALADSFSKSEERNTEANRPQQTAAVVLVIKALVTPAMRADKPDAAFSGFTSVEDLAAKISAVFAGNAAELNGTRVNL